jgi:predicted ester cyclase
MSLGRRHAEPGHFRSGSSAVRSGRAEDCLFEDMPTGESYRGHGGVRTYYTEWWTAFGNVPARSRRYVPADDGLIVETRFVGTHRGTYRGIEPTGRPIDLPVAIFVSFRDGLMLGERFYYDRSTLLAQISASA